MKLFKKEENSLTVEKATIEFTNGWWLIFAPDEAGFAMSIENNEKGSMDIQLVESISKGIKLGEKRIRELTAPKKTIDTASLTKEEKLSLILKLMEESGYTSIDL